MKCDCGPIPPPCRDARQGKAQTRRNWPRRRSRARNRVTSSRPKEAVGGVPVCSDLYVCSGRVSGNFASPHDVCYNPAPVLLLAWYVDKDATRASSELRRPCKSHIQASSPDGRAFARGIMMLYSISGSSRRELAGLRICECSGGILSKLRRTTLTIIL